MPSVAVIDRNYTATLKTTNPRRNGHTMAASARWSRLAELLEARRSELRPEWTDRSVFARDNGLSYRTLSDLEKARRENYKPGWLRRVERAYRWEPGSVQHVLDGFDPSPMPASEEAQHESPHADLPEGGNEPRLDGPVADLLSEGESLRWWQTPLGRTYRLESATPGYAVEAGFGANEQPEDVIDDLRQLLESTLAQAEVLAKRRSGGRRARRP